LRAWSWNVADLRSGVAAVLVSAVRHHIPAVVLTTSSTQVDILRSYKLHPNAYITKPADFDQYLKAVRQNEFFVQVVRLPPRG
jgi:DNA-binding NarL/FixJ family response regulator